MEDGKAWLEGLLGPVSIYDFADRYWEQKHLYVPGGLEGKTDSLLSESEFNGYLSRNDVRYPAIQIVKDGRNVPLKEYARDLKIGTYSSEGLIDMDLVSQSYKAGGTVVVQLMQNSFSRIAELSIALGSFLKSRVDVHGFLTPPAAQGLSAHYDAASAFLVQVKGSKRWRLFEMQVEAPGPDQTFDSRRPVEGEPIADITLNSGDVLYLPRGLPHEGITLDKDSLHLTIVLFPPSWIDILTDILANCQSREDFRKAPAEFSFSSGEPNDSQHEWERLVQMFSEGQSTQPDGEAKMSLVPQNARRGRWI